MAAKSKKSRVMGMAPMMDKKWQTEDDLRTLVRAAEIRGDKQRLKAAQALAREQIKQVGAVAGGK